MKAIRLHLALLAALPVVATAFWASAVNAQAPETREPAAAPAAPEDVQDSRELVREAVMVVGKMKSDPDLKGALGQARGVFIVPNYVRAGLGVGGRGGKGVLLARDQAGGEWGGPVFYNAGAINVGLQAGAEAGSVAFLLMTDKAVDAFKGDGTFALNADAGYTILDASAQTQATAGRNVDVIAWSDTTGLFAGATVGIAGIQVSEDENRAYYGAPNATPQAILSGQVKKQGAGEDAELRRSLNP